jgi:hypothetical protein
LIEEITVWRVVLLEEIIGIVVLFEEIIIRRVILRR